MNNSDHKQHNIGQDDLDVKTSAVGPSNSLEFQDIEQGECLVGHVQVLQRRLKARHIQMIAIGSNIGTGLFVGSGKALHTGGPLSLILGFVCISAALTIMMQCLAEMATVLPTSGSFTRYATRFFDPSLGFAMGWQYWLCWVAVFGAESSSFVILVNYWNDNARFTPLWITIFIILNLAIHCAPVRIFGEVEVIVSIFKVITVVGFIVITWAIIGGAGSTGYVHHGETWILPGLHNGIANGFKGLAAVFVTAAFAAGGTEMVGVVSGETQHPKYNLPRAIKTLMWRVVIFYVFSMLFLSLVVDYNDPNLLGENNANSSPFVISIRQAGIAVLPDLLNAIIVICVISVGSTSIYTGSRVLKSLADEGFAFEILGQTDRLGRPYTALLFTSACGIVLAYLNCSSTGSIIFGWFSSISGLAFFIAWLVIISCNFRFHAALKAQHDDALQKKYAFQASLWPWLPAFGMILVSFMLICQFIVSVSPIAGPPSATTFFSNFLGGPIFIAMWAGHKLIFKTKVKGLIEIDLVTDRLPDDPEEIAKFEHYYSLDRWQRLATYFHF